MLNCFVVVCEPGSHCISLAGLETPCVDQAHLELTELYLLSEGIHMSALPSIFFLISEALLLLFKMGAELHSSLSLKLLPKK